MHKNTLICMLSQHSIVSGTIPYKYNNKKNNNNLKSVKRLSFVIGLGVCQKKMSAQFQEIVSTSASSVFGILLAF